MGLLQYHLGKETIIVLQSAPQQLESQEQTPEVHLPCPKQSPGQNTAVQSFPPRFESMHSQFLSGKLAKRVPLQDQRRQMLQSGPPQSDQHSHPFSLHSPWPEHSSLMTLILLIPLICRLLGQAGTVQLRPVQPLLHWLSPNSELRMPAGADVSQKTSLCRRYVVSDACCIRRMLGLVLSLGMMIAIEKSAEELKVGQSEEQKCGVRLVTLSAPVTLVCMKVRQRLRVWVLRLQQMFQPPKRTDLVQMLPASLSTGELQRMLMLWLSAEKRYQYMWFQVCRKRMDWLPVSMRSMQLMFSVGK